MKFGTNINYENYTHPIKSPKRMLTLSISSGKGGVGKTLTTIHLAASMSNIGFKVLVIDGDLGLANIDVILGKQSQYDLNDLMEGFVEIEDILQTGPGGFQFISSGSGITKLQNLTLLQKKILIEKIKSISHQFDFILIDTGAGIGDNVLHFNTISDRRLIVTTPEPHAITDAYALIKTLKEEKNLAHFELLVNMSASEQEAYLVFRRIYNTCAKFLNIDIDYLGYIPNDKNVHSLILKKAIGTNLSSKTLSGLAWGQIAKHYTSNFQDFENNAHPMSFWRDFLT